MNCSTQLENGMADWVCRILTWQVWLETSPLLRVPHHRLKWVWSRMLQHVYNFHNLSEFMGRAPYCSAGPGFKSRLLQIMFEGLPLIQKNVTRFNILLQGASVAPRSLCGSKGPLWPQEAAVFTLILVMSLFLSYSAWPQYSNVCIVTTLTALLAYSTENMQQIHTLSCMSRILSTWIKIHGHIAKYLIIKRRNGIIFQLRHYDCIGRHRYYGSCQLTLGPLGGHLKKAVDISLSDIIAKKKFWGLGKIWIWADTDP